ncbi:MAG: GAF domain-containing protein [Desulfarculus sp.]|nr:GAF domain-containing protein [Pseudomonadota bacterium]MBV1714689.1 GAF domain-containing protein [Desulfarculus sp.]MBU4577036.1 GAF domain-containing protein [Pseudomonadota bacterium]MBU4600025.1 GAF domain-containing protein [Pseudomonadota bacterium]MBV1740226.1 GAF domain-containing protein [Desulfarculus sp.]
MLPKDPGGFAFECVLSLEPLIEFVREKLSSGRWPANPVGDDLLARLDNTPELRGAIQDLEVLKKHQGLLLRLMSLVFPPVAWDTEAFAAVVPFVLTPVMASPQFEELFINPPAGKVVRRNIDDATFLYGRTIKAYMFILDSLYGMDQRMDYPLAMVVRDEATGLERHFAIQLDFRFVRPEPVGEPIVLSEADLQFVRENITAPEALRSLMPPERFRLTGFTAMKAVEVTVFETVSALSRDLIDQDTVMSRAGFLRLQERLRTYFGRGDLVAGVAAMHQDQVILLNVGCQIDEDSIFGQSHQAPMEQFKGTLFDKLSQDGELVVVADVATEPGLAEFNAEYIKSNIRSLMIAPLLYQGNFIGSLEVGLPEVDQFNPTDMALMTQLQPLFTVAVKNALNDLDKQIQAVIKQQCTAVHPSVEWRFEQAALRHLAGRRQGRSQPMEPIVFNEVYPLFASSDIRDSSRQRNQAIAQDLARHMDLGLDVVRRAHEIKPLPILGELAGRIERRRNRLEGGLKTGDETGLADFTRYEVESVFDDLAKQGPKVQEAIALYREEVDPHLGTVYHQRRRFEKSVSLLNERMAAYLDREEAAMQTELPHYYERHRTDGLDHLIYLGASLSPNGDFSRLHLSNFRLWQLMVTCGLAWHGEQLKKQMPVPLDTAHLIFIQETPLNIRFRYDEKRFDVDGAYDVRHEIIRSRLDKAVISGGERLTQPGKIAMVFSSLEEVREMRRHVEHLQEQGFLLQEVERHELEDLPGVRGLKALRVGINLDGEALARRARSFFEGD